MPRPATAVLRAAGERVRRQRSVVPPCRCAGACRCGSLVPALLMRQLELECEFYREVL